MQESINKIILCEFTLFEITLFTDINSHINHEQPNPRNETSHQLILEEKSYLHKINLKGADAKSPDEIIGKLQSLYYENMMKNRSVQQEFQNYYMNNKGTGTPMWDPKAALKQANLGHLIK